VFQNNKSLEEEMKFQDEETLMLGMSLDKFMDATKAPNFDFDRLPYRAVKEGKLDLVRYIVKRGAIFDEYQGVEVIREVMKRGHHGEKIAKILWDHSDARIYTSWLSEKEQNIGIYLGAAQFGSLENLKECLENDPSVYKGLDSKGTTAGMFAAEGGHLRILDYMTENHSLVGGFVESVDRFCLLAASVGKVKVVEHIVTNQCSRSQEDEDKNPRIN
jgi:hypothetical protein